MLRAISSFSSGRRSKWVVVGAWVVVAFALFQFQPKLQEATTNENEAFLPENAESTEVNDIVGDEFPDGREVDAIVIYTRGSEKLTEDDFAQIEEDAAVLCEPGELEGVLTVIGPRGPIECEAATGTEQLTQLGSDPASGESQGPPRARHLDLRGRLDRAPSHPHQLRRLRRDPGERRGDPRRGAAG